MLRRLKNTLRCCVGVTFVLLSALTSWGDVWERWGGVDGQGVATSTAVPLRWSESENVVWKTPVPGKGWSSPVIGDSLVWLTTAEVEEASEEEREERRKHIANRQPVHIVASVAMKVVAIDRHTGEIVHNVEVLNREWPEAIHVTNSYATPTPVLVGNRIYCHFGTYGTVCLNTETAEVLWKNTEVKLDHENGPGSSPIVHGDLVIFNCDGIDTQTVAALDKSTGELVWRTERSGELNPIPQLRKAYATPMVVDLGAGEQLISAGADWLYAYKLETGEELWKLPFGKLGFSHSARPLVKDGRLFIATGFMKPRLLAIDCPPKVAEPRIAWALEKQVGNVATPVIVNDLIFVVSDEGVASCVEAETGEVHWRKRIAGKHWSSPLAVGDAVIFASRDGNSIVVKASDTFEVIAENQLDGSIMASTAAVDGALYIRTEKAMYRIENLQ